MLDPIAIALAGVGTSPLLMATDGFIGGDQPDTPMTGTGWGNGHRFRLSHYRGAHKTYKEILIEKDDGELIAIARAFVENVLMH